MYSADWPTVEKLLLSVASKVQRLDEDFVVRFQRPNESFGSILFPTDRSFAVGTSRSFSGANVRLDVPVRREEPRVSSISLVDAEQHVEDKMSIDIHRRSTGHAERRIQDMHDDAEIDGDSFEEQSNGRLRNESTRARRVFIHRDRNDDDGEEERRAESMQLEMLREIESFFLKDASFW